MNTPPFQAGGPLMADSPWYVLRRADRKANAHLGRMEYITLIEPRQTGKTSLINRLVAQFSTLGYDFAFRYLRSATPHSNVSADWYFDLGSHLADQLSSAPPGGPPTDSASWERFLVEVAKQAQAADRRLVIILDEIGAVPSDFATDFFSVIRSVYTTRQIFPYYRHLSFIIAGTFDPRMLIQDSSVSDFNVDHRIQLEDFSLEQLRGLVSLIGLSEALTDALAERIYHWSDGQPYICQWFCLQLYEQKDVLDVDNAGRLVEEDITRFLQEERQHLMRVKELLARPELLARTIQLITEPRVKLSAGINDDHFHLSQVLGVIKADAAGLCKIRNRVYERALAEAAAWGTSAPPPTESPTSVPADGFIYDVFDGFDPEGAQPVEVFILSAPADEEFRQQLEKHLSILSRQGFISTWNDREISAGSERQPEIDSRIESAELILLLISEDFISSDFYYGVEMSRALKRHEDGTATVIPVILKPVAWEGAPFGRLAMLPTDAKPITKWRSKADAFTDVARGIRKVVKELSER